MSESISFEFSEEHQMLREVARKFTDSEVRPLAQQIDENEEVPLELIKKAAELDLLGIPFPEQYGGAGLGEIGYCVLLEEVARGCNSTAVIIGGQVSLGGTAIHMFGSEEQKQKYLPLLIRGEKIAAFALTEPEAGSDAANIKTTAVKDGDDYVLNGNKTFITNGSIAGVIVTFAVTDKSRGHRGITAFIVESDMSGYRAGKHEKKMGIRGTYTTDLFFEDMRVPRGNILGAEGEGFRVAMMILDSGRTSLAAQCLGSAKELLDLSIKYAKERVQFGKPIADKQAIQFMLADMSTDVYLMESILYRTAWMSDRKMKFSRESAIVKLFCSEAVCRVADKAVQIHGGMGYMREYPIERFYRDVRINRIYEGTNEIQRIIVARDLLKRERY